MSPRHDLDAEKQVLGACLHDQRLVSELDLSAEDFYQPVHAQLWAMMGALDRAGERLDPISLGQRTDAAKIPGFHVAYLHELYQGLLTKASAGHHARILRGLSMLRAAETAAAGVLQQVRDAGWDAAPGILEEARASLDAVTSRQVSDGGATFEEALAAALDDWEKPIQPGIPTGWAELDDVLSGGWKPGQLTIVGARPAVGKSVIAGCAALTAAKHGCGYFSLEMSRTEAVGRIAAAAKRIEISRLTKHSLESDDWEKLAALSKAASSWSLMIDDRPRLSMAQVRSTVRSWSRRFPPKLVIIDYLQIMRPADERVDNRERQVNRLAEDCKLLAREFGVHVLALAQVGRGSVARADKKPIMADLRESGGIEAHADNIILLHRDEEHPGEIELIIEKNRHGRTGSIALEWAPYYAQVRSSG